MTTQLLDDMVRGYLTCALWSAPDDEEGNPLDHAYDISNFTAESLERAREDCRKFLEAHPVSIRAYCDHVDTSSDGDAAIAYAGHDLWLTRNGHGCGFWDREGIPTIAGQALTDAARALGETSVYEIGGEVALESA